MNYRPVNTAHAPRKRFGQHFLKDQTVIERIIASFAPLPEQHIVEIGPGQGALTLPLLKVIPKLEAVELDRDLIDTLQRRADEMGELKIHLADALQFDFQQIKNDARLIRIIGNLPYNISTPLLFHLLDYASIIEDMVVMLQKEVADRIAATPNSDDYGRLSVMMQYYCRVDLLFDVPPKAFFPPPQVNSSIIKITPYKTLPVAAIDATLFATIVKLAFGQRRKTLRNSLNQIIDASLWDNIQISSSKRAENLSVSDFVTISNMVSLHKAKEK